MAYAQAIIAIATAVASATTGIVKGVSAKRENERARDEARRLAEIQRQDTLSYQGKLNDLTANKLTLNQNKLDFSKAMTKSDIRQKEDQRDFEVGKLNQDTLEQTADANLDPLKINRRRFL